MEHPVFIFGTGRCGSTHLQRLVSLSTRTWIWGEHDGFLAPLLRGVHAFETSKPLARNVFERLGDRSDERLLVHMERGTADLPWLNRLDPEAVRKEARSMIDRLFRSGLPEGWSEWGIKEILYGLNNETPRQLLDLFPTARAAFTFRRPKETIESMIRAWTPRVLSDPSSTELEEMFQTRATRWMRVTGYFLKLKEEHDGRLRFFSTEELLQEPPATILRVLGVEADPGRRPPSLGVTNPGPRQMPAWARAKLDALYAEVADEAEELYRRALATSRRDASLGEHAV